jgi:hypothetical protein
MNSTCFAVEHYFFLRKLGISVKLGDMLCYSATILFRRIDYENVILVKIK